MHEIEECRVSRRANRCPLGYAERRGFRAQQFIGRNHMLSGEFRQDKVAPCQRPAWVTPGVVVRRPLDQAYQQRRLRQIELLQRSVEVELRGKAEAVDRAVAVLAEVNFVYIGFEDFVLAVVRVQQHRHDGLDRFAAQRALRAQVEILDQLLR